MFYISCNGINNGEAISDLKETADKTRNVKSLYENKK